MHDVANRVELELFVRSFFSTRPPDRVMRQFSAIMRELSAPAGTVLFERGAPNGELFLIAEGTVATVGDDGSRWIFEGQSLVGVVDAMINRPHTRSAVVEEHVVGAQVSFDDYMDVLEDNFEFAKVSIERSAALTHERQLDFAPDGVFAAPTEDPGLIARGKDPRPLEMVERLMVLYRSSIFAESPIQPVVTLAMLAEEERWEDNERVFEFGAPMTHLRFVAAGRVEASREQPVVRGTFGPGDLIGSTAAVGHDRYQYTMTAVGPTRTLRIAKEDLFDVIEDHFGVARAMFAQNARENIRIRSQNATAETQTLDLKAPEASEP